METSCSDILPNISFCPALKKEVMFEKEFGMSWGKINDKKRGNFGVNLYFKEKGTLPREEQVVSTAGLNHDALRSAVGAEASGTKLAQNESDWGGEFL